MLAKNDVLGDGTSDVPFWRDRRVRQLNEPLRKGCIAAYWLMMSASPDGRVPVAVLNALRVDLAEADELVRVGLWGMDGMEYRILFGERLPKTSRQIVLRWLSDHGMNGPNGWAIKSLNSLAKGYEPAEVIAIWESAPKEVRTPNQYVQFAEQELESRIPNRRNGNGKTPSYGRSAKEVQNAFNRQRRPAEISGQDV